MSLQASIIRVALAHLTRIATDPLTPEQQDALDEYNKHDAIVRKFDDLFEKYEDDRVKWRDKRDHSDWYTGPDDHSLVLLADKAYASARRAEKKRDQAEQKLKSLGRRIVKK